MEKINSPNCQSHHKIYNIRRVKICGSYIITGGKRLEGEVVVSGSKNASLPILAASVLHNGITKLYNVPNIHDTKVMIEILRNLGCKVKRVHDKIVIDARGIKNHEIPEELMRKMRSSVILAGALIGRFKSATFCCPRWMRYWCKTN